MSFVGGFIIVVIVVRVLIEVVIVRLRWLEAARSAAIPVGSIGALPGEALAPLPVAVQDLDSSTEILHPRDFLAMMFAGRRSQRELFLPNREASQVVRNDEGLIYVIDPSAVASCAWDPDLMTYDEARVSTSVELENLIYTFDPTNPSEVQFT